MKQILLCCLTALLSFAACTSWNDSEPLYPDDLENSVFDEAYYRQIRHFKQTDHPLSAGLLYLWEPSFPHLKNSLSGVPDSLDLVGVCQGWNHMNTARIQDLQKVRQQKGTKVLIRTVLSDIGQDITPLPANLSLATRKAFWGWVDNDTLSIREAIRRYAFALCDTIDRYDFDGLILSVDAELKSDLTAPLELLHPAYNRIFIESLTLRIGPSSRSRKRLILDTGTAIPIDPSLANNIDLFIFQIYGCFRESAIDYMLKKLTDYFREHYPSHDLIGKTLLCENFARFGATGGNQFISAEGVRMQSLEGMSRWIRKHNTSASAWSGVCTFYMETEYILTGKRPTYPALRQAIQILNQK